MELTIHIDGGARGNPGPAGAGVVIRQSDGPVLLEAGYYLGSTTNNFAEYTALLRGLEAAQRFAPERIEIFSDSELLVRQINGEYRVRSGNLKDLFHKATTQLAGFKHWRIRHVRREQNARADELANLAMDAMTDVIVTGPDDSSDHQE